MDHHHSKSHSTETQHDKLRKRLQDELHLNNMDDSDMDWFLRVSSTTPSTSTSTSTPLTTTTNAKSPPTLSTTDAFATSGHLLSQDSNGNGSRLTRSKTFDYSSMSNSSNLSKLNSSSSTGSGLDSAKLTRTSTNVNSTDFSFKKKTKKQTPVQSVDIPHSSSSSPIIPPSSPLSPSSAGKKKGGFFKKMFGRKSESQSPMSPAPNSVASKGRRVSSASIHEPIIINNSNNISINNNSNSVNSSVPTPQQRFGSPIPSISSSISNLAIKNNNNNDSDQKIDALFDSNNSNNNTSTSEEDEDGIDSQLQIYLHEIEAFNNSFSSNSTQQQKQDTSSDDISVASSTIYAPSTTSVIHYEQGVIPPHPNQPKLPSAMSLTPKYSTGRSLEIELADKKRKERLASGATAGRFGGLLHRTKSSGGTTSHAELMNEELLNNLLSSGSGNESGGSRRGSATGSGLLANNNKYYTPPPPKSQHRQPPLSSLSHIRPLKKVAFATTTFVNDPPQQIPSRNPRKGNVEIGLNGEIIIHSIDPKLKCEAGGGIVVGGSGHLKLVEAARAKAAAEAEAANAANAKNGGGSGAGDKLDGAGSSAHAHHHDSTGSGSTRVGGESAVSMNREAGSTSSLIKREDKLLAAARAHDSANTHKDSELLIGDGRGSGNSGMKIKIDKPMVRHLADSSHVETDPERYH
ncbi:unnamed protein product [Ambrosiozyma monospora]|uniref:Unnamed protein product n=1 Tax=Ambrosiozyma monospora TaxID=43982 RepID=A0A9W6Z052_AMBMO|nr:unnamed protein product [Ambrosiozyma monospora]